MAVITIIVVVKLLFLFSSFFYFLFLLRSVFSFFLQAPGTTNINWHHKKSQLRQGTHQIATKVEGRSLGKPTGRPFSPHTTLATAKGVGTV